ncbi:hypothetical protein [Phycisphaera mikurensis]|uniref:Uncharacterized protein n=1 Tax=Phycisphaera mikurensis (strain NBRC 102666 / KCTC 22515 / FYK2301M01) TaxID=1142394 RepID=I0IF72_PHYMF|nr:hypothetical protein [Phycisphaera mikurensis]MBB6440694.1 hypothetical protein [Phycisphaera mikurensis]BAM03910.1 hypothetical protein PSMK_17510 [Phycisphaera mikurensis NBRC 102666]
MPRPARFPGRFAGPLALTAALAALLAGSTVLAARVSQPDERRVAWKGVSLVLPGGFVPLPGQGGVFAVFRDRLREERELQVFRLRAQAGSTGAADLAEGHEEAAQAPPGPAGPVAYPPPEAVLRIAFPTLLGGVRLPEAMAIDRGVKVREDGSEVPFAVWAGAVADPDVRLGQAPRLILGVMVTGDGLGNYAVILLRDPAYRQEDLTERLRATAELLKRTLETVQIRPSLPPPAGAGASMSPGDAGGGPS